MCHMWVMKAGRKAPAVSPSFLHRAAPLISSFVNQVQSHSVVGRLRHGRGFLIYAYARPARRRSRLRAPYLTDSEFTHALDRFQEGTFAKQTGLPSSYQAG